MDKEFNWDDDSVVFGSVRGIAAYFNPAGDIVIRQEAGPLDQSDSVIVVPVDRLEALIEALQTLSAQVP